MATKDNIGAALGRVLDHVRGRGGAPPPVSKPSKLNPLDELLAKFPNRVLLADEGPEFAGYIADLVPPRTDETMYIDFDFGLEDDLANDRCTFHVIFVSAREVRVKTIAHPLHSSTRRSKAMPAKRDALGRFVEQKKGSGLCLAK